MPEATGAQIVPERRGAHVILYKRIVGDHMLENVPEIVGSAAVKPFQRLLIAAA